MFNLFGRTKQSRKTRRSNPNTSKIAKRQLFLESLEDRRLLAADLSIVDFSINASSVAIGDLTAGTGNPMTETAGSNQLIVTIEVDDLLNPGIAGTPDPLTADVDLQLTLASLVSTGTVLSDISVDDGGTPSLSSAISLTVGAGSVEGLYTFTVDIGAVGIVERDETFNMNIIGDDSDSSPGTEFATNFTIEVIDNDQAQISVLQTSGGASAVAISDIEPNLGAVNVGFELTGNFEETLTGDVNVVSGTAVPVTGGAVPGEDYTFTLGSFSAILTGSGFDPSVINVVNDSVVEEDQQLTVALSNLQLGGVVLSGSELADLFSSTELVSTITIENDDNATITLRDKTTGNATAATVAEDGATTVVEWDVSAPIELAAGTAAATFADAGSGAFPATEAVTGSVGD
nr:hypothetical protein [Pirellulaceae bacterium]